MDAPGVLSVDWMSGPVAPENLLEMLSCKCTRRCTLSDSLSENVYQKMCDALHYLLDNIFIRFGSKLYRQIVGIPMGTNCAPLSIGLKTLMQQGISEPIFHGDLFYKIQANCWKT